jgi:nitrogen fixation/metabolism regulation signal transduction histidine kinase
MLKRSLFLRLYLATAFVLLSYGAVLFALAKEVSFIGIEVMLVSACFLLVLLLVSKWCLAPLVKTLSAIDNGIDAFKDNDFSLTIHNQNYSEISSLIQIYNELSTVLRNERMDIFQRELLLDTVIQSTPVAMVLVGSNNRVVYSNLAAKEMFCQNKKLEGDDFTKLLANLTPVLQAATLEKNEGLVTDLQDEQALVYNINCQQFVLNGREHLLYLYKNMTSEISRKETDMWKQVIRLISHELNNSLAPISSLTRSAQKIITQPEHSHMLYDVLETIGNRASHLHGFIEQYASFSRLPKPKFKAVILKTFYQQIETLVGVNCCFDVVREQAMFDAGQIEQVIINLIKNAKESGSELTDVGFEMKQQGKQLTFNVFDRGTGLSAKQQQQALLPFFTTKPTGTGVGLALCNEIVIGHQGKLRLYNRQQGGLCVSFSLELTD